MFENASRQEEIRALQERIRGMQRTRLEDRSGFLRPHLPTCLCLGSLAVRVVHCVGDAVLGRELGLHCLGVFSGTRVLRGVGDVLGSTTASLRPTMGVSSTGDHQSP